MGLTLLVSSLNKDVDELIEKMHLDSDAVIVNQCDTDSSKEMEYNSHRVKVICSKSRGVGVNRNMCIDEAFGEYALFCDDDIVYDEGYEKKVIDEFASHPEADMIMFNFNVCEERRTYYNTEYKKLGRYNIGRYPAYSIAVRTDVLKDKGLKYSTLFGGGAKYSNGEDSIFLKDAFEKKVSMYASPVLLGSETPGESTWFAGFNEKFFFDRGVLFAFLYGKRAWLWRLRFILVKKEMFKGEIDRKKANRLMKDGIREGYRLLQEND